MRLHFGLSHLMDLYAWKTLNPNSSLWLPHFTYKSQMLWGRQDWIVYAVESNKLRSLGTLTKFNFLLKAYCCWSHGFFCKWWVKDIYILYKWMVLRCFSYIFLQKKFAFSRRGRENRRGRKEWSWCSWVIIWSHTCQSWSHTCQSFELGNGLLQTRSSPQSSFKTNRQTWGIQLHLFYLPQV